MTFSELTSALSFPSEVDYCDQLSEVRDTLVDSIVVLDDDPTGTQTVYGIPVLTTWEKEDILSELENDTGLFFILTNSRGLASESAVTLASEIGKNIRAAQLESGKRCMVISRSDSTLRGHYPEEVIALGEHLDRDGDAGAFVHILIPAFFEGGRYTIDDIHYVREGEDMIPAADTPFANDAVFGYKSSNLVDWVVEKTGGGTSKENVKSLSLKKIRTLSTDDLVTEVARLAAGDVCVVNAVTYQDIRKATLAILQSRIQVIFRTAASFVSAIACLPEKSLLSDRDFENNLDMGHGGLIIVGSYVPKTSLQLHHALRYSSARPIELSVDRILKSHGYDPTDISRTIDAYLSHGQDVIVYTSRKLVVQTGEDRNLKIGATISNFITEVVAAITVRPRYILAKGGITSSDVATVSLGVCRAVVQGQVLPGVPVWELASESKFPGLQYIIFPGNVGTEKSLAQVINRLTTNR